MYVLDASVVAKWFVVEEGDDIALSLRKQFEEKEIDIVVPDLLLYEIANALSTFSK
ncbi:MAG: type II toxin-antitoxin system VapC family toxin [Candidatus Thermoplasmatota archaeon]|nr:type II toxin-antitoxin system VapC family toxin [Candidatus Thermoplasmatota archaeon]